MKLHYFEYSEHRHCPNYAEAATGDVFTKSCSEEFRYICRKTLVFEFAFNNAINYMSNYIKKRL